MRKIAIVVLVLFALSIVPNVGWAASPWTSKSTYSEKMVGKLGFGLKNVLLGWTELFKAPVRHYQDADKNKFGNGLLGLGEGVYNTLLYTVGGAIHLVTFPITAVDIPIVNDGVHCEKCPLGKM